ncbi:MAG: hypothetical protein EOM54_05640 [Clostridia bacterium]|nr:hypothetical protein [Clostridia bacterium]
MAGLTVNGLEGLILSMEEVSKLSLDDKKNILSAGAEIVQKAHKKMLESLGLIKTGKLLKAISSFWKISEGGYFLIYPYGEHHDYNMRLVTKMFSRSKHGTTYTVGGHVQDVSAGEVGYILEMGAPSRGIIPFRWMQRANEQCADEMAEAEASVWDRHLTDCGF